jgi:hypothetical protein
MKEIVERIMADSRYQKNIDDGAPRSGHPEGKVKFHIAELEENLEKLVPRGISEEQYWKLKFLVMMSIMPCGNNSRRQVLMTLSASKTCSRQFKIGSFA